jgi:hypothetical protein
MRLVILLNAPRNFTQRTSQLIKTGAKIALFSITFIAQNPRKFLQRYNKTFYKTNFSTFSSTFFSTFFQHFFNIIFQPVA